MTNESRAKVKLAAQLSQELIDQKRVARETKSDQVPKPADVPPGLARSRSGKLVRASLVKAEQDHEKFLASIDIKKRRVF